MWGVRGYLFRKPAGHREVAPREFDMHSRWKPTREQKGAEERREKKNKKKKKKKKKPETEAESVARFAVTTY